VIGEEQEKTSESERLLKEFRRKEFAREFARRGQPKEARPAWLDFELASKHQFGGMIQPAERLTKVTGEPRMRPEWFIPGSKKEGLAESGFLKPERLGARFDEKGRLRTLSLMEATANTGIFAEGNFGKGGGRKRIQFRGYLSALKIDLDRLRAEGKVAKKLEVRIHYFNPEPPEEGMQKEMLDVIREIGLPVTVFWRRMS
jgi:hypothetical protein